MRILKERTFSRMKSENIPNCAMRVRDLILESDRGGLTSTTNPPNTA